MLKSMTGFGRSLLEDSDITQQWEIRSVNGRHLDMRWHVPVSLRSLQTRLEKLVRKYALRGRVDVHVLLQYGETASHSASFDSRSASSMLDSLRLLAQTRNDDFIPDYNALLHISSLWGEDAHVMDEGFITRLEEGLMLALEDWNESRATEGQGLALDIRSRILRMEEWVDSIRVRVPDIKEERMNNLRERLSETLSTQGLDLEEGRFLQEIVILTDKLDVSEELTRLHCHLQRLNELLQVGKDAGRRLDFTLQECFREINTCGNKIPDVHLSRLVVDFKNELEKCREQVQNLE